MAAAVVVLAAPITLVVLALVLVAVRAPGVPVRRVRPGRPGDGRALR